MKFIFSLLIFVFTLPAFSQVTVDVKLSPAGSFKIETSKIKGAAKKAGDGISAENIIVDANSLKTGIELRDKHMKERLLTDKFPTIKLLSAKGTSGKGTGVVEIMGKKQNVTGTYKVSGNSLIAEFPIKLSPLDIKGVRYMGVGVKDEVLVKVKVPLQ